MTGAALAAAPRLIGGVFPVESLSRGPAPGRPAWLSERAWLLANARSALFVLISQLRPRRVWLPSYLCSAVPEAAHAAAARVEFYDVGAHLGIGERVELGGVERGDLVVAIDYYGVRWDERLLAGLAAAGAWVVEDASQALLSRRAGRGAHAVVFSPRKFLGVPDGGILVPERGLPLAPPRLAPAPAAWRRLGRAAVGGRRRFDASGGERDWYAAFQEAERTQPVGAYSMSRLTRRLLAAHAGYGEIAARRRANYAVLQEALAPWAVIPALPAGAVPAGFPVRLARRERVRQALFAENVFPPVHWPLEGVVPARFAESHRLAAESLTLPCDQRYDADDMARIAERVRAHAG